jgi:glutathione S-transferase
MLRLYHHWSSVCAQKVRIVLAEKILDWESRHIDLFAFEQWDRDFLKLNPKAAVPILDHDGHIVTESNIIIEYLDEVFPDNPLRPNDLKLRSKMRRWMLFSEEDLHMSIATASFNPRHRVRMVAKYSNDELISIAKSCPFPEMGRRMLSRLEPGVPQEEEDAVYDKIMTVMDWMEADLTSGQWLIVGNQFTLADIAMAPYINRIEVLAHPEFITDRPHILNWWQRIQELPCYQKAMSFPNPDPSDPVIR